MALKIAVSRCFQGPYSGFQGYITNANETISKLPNVFLTKLNCINNILKKNKNHYFQKKKEN